MKMKINKKVKLPITEPPINEIKIICQTAAPTDVINELGRSRQIQELKRFTYLDFEFRVMSVGIEELPVKIVLEDEQIDNYDCDDDIKYRIED